jgi:S-formylglutathione hydrolase
MTIEKVSSWKCFDGTQEVHAHASSETGTRMRFGLFLPPQAKNGKVPVLFWLSGLTCTEDNFITKAGAQRVASELGIAIVAPDTSPRGLGYAGEDDAYDFGTGAGFYVDATEAPWKNGYRMYSYVTKELPALVLANFPLRADRMGIFGHSMGGHGALTIAMKNPDRFRTVSAFAPIVAPMQVPWGQKALAGYLGNDRETWKAYDASALVASRGWKGPKILVDQGGADNFLKEQLRPELFEAACRQAGVALELHLRDGYDHSYYFISTFIANHLRHHAAHLG